MTAFDRAWDLLKALGEEGDLFYWDKRLYPETARTFSTGRGPAYERIFDYISNVVGPDKVSEFFDTNRVSYPVEGREIAPWREVMESSSPKKGRDEALALIGGKFGAPNKMPGPTFSLPTHLCNRGGVLREVPGSTCNRCYAHGQGNYGFNNVLMSQWRNAHALLTPDEEGTARYASAMANRIPASSFDFGDPYFRWFDSGDLQGAEHLSMISDIARNINDQSRFPVQMWLPTREEGAISRLLDARGWDDALPENLAVRLSAPFTGQTLDDDVNRELGLPALPRRFHDILEHPQVSFSATSAASPDIHICPASIGKLGGKCDDYGCRKCWDPAANISYNMHTGGSKSARTPLFGGGRVDYTSEGIPLIDRARMLQGDS